MRLRIGGRTPPSITQFSRVPLGGGGFVCDLRISDDGLTRVHKTDVSLAYIWKNPNDLSATDETGEHADFQWHPVMSEASMAGDDLFVQGNYGNGFGAHDIVFAPSDPTIVYILGPGLNNATSYLFRSTDRATTFTKKDAAGLLGPAGDLTRMWGPKAAVDPNDPDIVLWEVTYGADAGKVYRTTDGGDNIAASSFPASGAVVLSSTNFYPAPVCFDPVNSGVVYAFRYGTGLYKSTDSGSNWSAVGGTGAPTTCRRLHVDKYGQVWVTAWTGSTGNLYRLNDDGTTWVNLTGATGFEWATVATNPLSASKAANQVTVGSDGGNINHSYDNGATWTGAYGSAAIRVANDIPWLADTTEDYMTAGNIVYDTQAISGFTRGKLHFVQGIGLWHTHPRTDNGQPTWTSNTLGNDELIPSMLYKLPGASRKCIVGVHDRGVFALDGINYPTAQLYDRGINLKHNYNGLDYAGLVPDEFAVNLTLTDPSQVFVSTDGGATGDLVDVQPYTGTAYSATARILSVGVSASGVANMVVAANDAGASPRYTTDGGATWSNCTMSGATYVGTGYTRLVGDKNTAGVFYLLDGSVSANAGIWRSTNNGATFTRVQEDADLPLLNGTDSRFISVPGQGDDMFLSFGWNFDGGASRVGGNLHPVNPSGTTYNGMLRFTGNGWTSFTDLSDNWLECFSVGVGKEKPGSSYPTIYVSGQKVGDTQPGIYRCTDFNPASPTAATFELLPGPYGTFDGLRFIDGDMEVYGDIWIGTASTGVIKGALR
jgi:hypothetical protein